MMPVVRGIRNRYGGRDAVVDESARPRARALRKEGYRGGLGMQDGQ